MFFEIMGMAIALCFLFGAALLHAQLRDEADERTKHVIVRTWLGMLALLAGGMLVRVALPLLGMR